MATNDKYDRQLRLWGANGQRALMQAHILLINADAVGTETLKNLVLPGIGRFTVLDEKKVTPGDLGNNFFVTADDVGRSRAEVVSELLCEMNPDVAGFAITAYPNDGSVGAEFWTQFTLVIAANLVEDQLMGLSTICMDHRVPLMVVRSYGLLGCCRLQLHQHEIIESKPDSDPYDLRIANPFTELESYCQSFNMAEMKSLEHSHTPYIVILYHAIMNWRRSHNGNLPANFADKEAFKFSLKGMSRDFNKEQNFEEAVKEAYRAFSSKTLPEEVLDLLVLQENKYLSAESSEFDFLMRALQLFLDAQQPPDNSLQPQFGTATWRALPAAQRWSTASPPLGGSIPDMVSTTAFFVGLQQLFQTKARADRLTFKSILSNVISEATRSSVPHAAMKMTRTSAAEISDDSIDIFCRNVFNVRAVTTRTVVAERQTAPAAEALASAVDDPFEDPVQTPIYWYLALRGVDRFQAKHGRWPGDTVGDGQLGADVDLLWGELLQLAEEYGCVEVPGSLSRDHAAEVVRYGGSELHSISALVGGVAAQEAVKIITHQYIPLNNTFVYNGVAGCGGTYEL